MGSTAHSPLLNAVWFDPHPKPSYLFAVVAGDLVAREASFTTRSGRTVACRVWTSAAEQPKSGWALESLLRAMKWDEDRFGLEYDLDQFNIVSTPDFNMGAMGALRGRASGGPRPLTHVPLLRRREQVAEHF